MSSRDSTRIITATTSGGSLGVQCAIIRDLYDVGFNHDIYMGTSGGAVSLYTLIAGGKCPGGMTRCVEGIDIRYMMKNWSTIPALPNYAMAFAKGSYFDLSPYCYENIKSMTTSSMMRDVEFWIGTTDLAESASPCMFCTTSRSQALLKPFDSNFTTHYLDGDLDNISRALVSSATIPFIMPASEINVGGEMRPFADGGLRASSPITHLINHLPHTPGHIDYISCSNINIPIYGQRRAHKGDMLKRGIWVLQEILRTNSMRDHDAALSYVNASPTTACSVRRPPDMEGRADRHTLIHLKRAREYYYRTVIEFYPEHGCELNLLNLRSSDVQRVMDKISFNYNYRLWYSS